jgi:hypothetical protein
MLHAHESRGIDFKYSLEEARNFLQGYIHELNKPPGLHECACTVCVEALAARKKQIRDELPEYERLVMVKQY